MTPEIDRISRIITETAAAEIMPRFRKLASGDVQMKSKDDPVTIADQETERQLTIRLTDILPGSTVVGEEGVARDKSMLARLKENTPVWIIDPIDGTRNFVAGVPGFAVMVALMRNREAVASWIHDPNSGDTIMAEQGAGVWLRGKKLRLAAADPTVQTVGLVGSRVKKMISDPSVMPQGPEMPKTEIGSCAGFDYPRLFVGETTFANSPKTQANFLFYRHTNPWDHVPGLFLLQEGGGYSANWAGKPYDLTDLNGGLIGAANKEDWLRLHHMFRPLMSHVVKNAVWEF